MRRVVTGVDQAGRSFVAGDDEVVASRFAVSIWTATEDNLPSWLNEMRAADIASNQPPPGGSRFVLVVLPPQAEYLASLQTSPIAGMDDRGFHTTRTIDYVYVLEGRIVLVLDEGSVELAPGDAVVQLATRHAWRNPGTDPARFLAVLNSPPEAQG
jgi:quercetin dioxygenase-like cupin family protein